MNWKIRKSEELAAAIIKAVIETIRFDDLLRAP